MFRTLIIAPTSLREAVMTQPLIAALARRGEVLAVAATPAVAPVYRAMGRTIAQVYELPFGAGRLDWGLRRAIGASWRRRYDVAYVLADRWFDALLPWFAGVPRRVGWAGGPIRSRLLNAALPETADTPASGVARFLALAGEEAAQPQPPELALVPERVMAVCQSYGLQPGGYWVIAPGADEAPARCWPPARYAELIRQLHDRSDLPAVLIGSGKDVALAQHIVAHAAPAPSRSLAGLLTTDVAAALIGGAAGLIGNDNGWMQLGAALGVPQVAVFGPTSTDEVQPLDSHVRTLRLAPSTALGCAPCGERACREGHQRCLADIGALQVIDALQAAYPQGGGMAVDGATTGSLREGLPAGTGTGAAGSAVHSAAAAA